MSAACSTERRRGARPASIGATGWFKAPYGSWRYRYIDPPRPHTLRGFFVFLAALVTAAVSSA